MFSSAEEQEQQELQQQEEQPSPNFYQKKRPNMSNIVLDRCLKGVYWVSERYLESVLKVYEGCMEGVWKVS